MPFSCPESECELPLMSVETVSMPVPGPIREDFHGFELSGRLLRVSGFDASLYSERAIETALKTAQKRASPHGQNADEWIFASQASTAEFIDILLVNDTNFFRANVNWDVIRDNILPRLYGQPGSIEIGCVGCSSGVECLSLACLITCFFPGREFQITGFDCDEQALRKMRWYLYDKEGQQQAQGILEEAATEYVPRSIQIPQVASLSDRIHSVRKNIFKELPPDAQFDLIMCANVLRHLNSDGRDILGVWLADALAPHGFVVTSEDEAMRPFCPDKLQSMGEHGPGFFVRRNGSFSASL